jgi:hypothetical protein
MIKVTYKPGKQLSSISNKNNYYQSYWNGKLWYKRLWHKGIRYQECYIWRNKGLKYRI